MQKILVISHSSVLEINRRLYEGMAENPSIEVGLLCPLSWEDKSLKRKYSLGENNSSKLKLFPLPARVKGNGSLFFYDLSDLKRVRDEFKPDILFIDEEPWAIVTWQIFKVFRETKAFIYTKQNLIKEYYWPFKSIEVDSYKKVEGFFAISKEAAEVLVYKGNTKPIEILPHAFDSGVFFPKENHSFPKEVFTIGYVGRLVVEKGVQDLLRAVRMLKKPKGLDVRVRIIGSGNSEGELKELSRRLKISESIEFVGPVGHLEVGKQYRQMDILAAPSQTTKAWKEQFGRMLIEAAACGIPVVGSDSGEIPNVIAKLQNGLIFKEKDHVELCGQLEKIIHSPDLWNQYRNRGLENVNTIFSYPGIIKTVLDFIL